MKREELIEEAAGAWRPRDPRDGTVRAHPAWMDLDAEGRVAAWREAAWARAIEAAADAGGLSATGKAVLARIRGAK
ncbi:MAG TPA: hypothetical protein VGL86_31900 [Polyangia bacterium]|jgi:hypothetical protein